MAVVNVILSGGAEFRWVQRQGHVTNSDSRKGTSHE